MVFSILNLSILVNDWEELFSFYKEKFINNECFTYGLKMFPAGLEPATFRVWGGRDNHYNTETHTLYRVDITYILPLTDYIALFPPFIALRISKQW